MYHSFTFGIIFQPLTETRSCISLRDMKYKSSNEEEASGVPDREENSASNKWFQNAMLWLVSTAWMHGSRTRVPLSTLQVELQSRSPTVTALWFLNHCIKAFEIRARISKSFVACRMWKRRNVYYRRFLGNSVPSVKSPELKQRLLQGIPWCDLVGVLDRIAESATRT